MNCVKVPHCPVNGHLRSFQKVLGCYKWNYYELLCNSVYGPQFSLLGTYMSRCGIAGWYGIYMFHLMRHCSTTFQRGCSVLLTLSSVRVLVVPHPCQRSVLSVFFSRCEMLSYYNFNLHFLSSNVDHFFMNLFCVILWCVHLFCTSCYFWLAVNHSEFKNFFLSFFNRSRISV